MFQPKGALMQVVLSSPELRIAPADLRVPIEQGGERFEIEPCLCLRPVSDLAHASRSGPGRSTGLGGKSSSFLRRLVQRRAPCCARVAFWQT
jgi:hypothetical protein